MAEEAGLAPVAGEGSLVPLIGKAGLVDVDGTAARTSTVVGEGLDVLFLKVLIKARVSVIGEAGEVVETNVPATTIVGIVASEHVESGRHGSSENVAGAG